MKSKNNARVMKIKNLILSITLVALTATSFGQRSSIRDRLFNKHNNQIEFITAEYNSNENSRIENWIHDLPGWFRNRTARNLYVTPAVTESFVIEQFDLVYEEPLGIESWMVTPFEYGVAEEELGLEPWMTAPFKSSLAEEEISLESWMTVPFKSTEKIEIEDWMVTAWF